MALLYGRAGHFTAQRGTLRPGQLARERLLGPVGTVLPALPDRLATLRSPRSPYAPRHSGSGAGVQYGRFCGTPRGTSYRTTQMDGSPMGGRWMGARSLALTTRW
jgi:hypothetical protein